MKEEMYHVKQFKSVDYIITRGNGVIPNSEDSFMQFLCSKEQAMTALDDLDLDDKETKLNEVCECSLFNFLRNDDKIQKINSNVFLVSENDNYNESNVYNDNDSTADL
jgi:hypothetical protein